MYPTLSDLLHDLFGLDIPLPVQTFGLFVAFAFLAASFILTKELRKKQTAGLLSSVKETLTIDRPFDLVSVAVDFTASSTIRLFLFTLINICFSKANWVNSFNSLGTLLYFKAALSPFNGI